MIHLIHPFRLDKNLGKAYNDAFERCPDGDWLCLMDWDIMFLTHDAVSIMERYVQEAESGVYGDVGIFTCFTNRIHSGAKDQLWDGVVSEDPNILNHIAIANKAKTMTLFPVTQINHHISGMMMLISKMTWSQVKFNEDMMCLGVDNEYSDRILAVGKKILRMNQIYAFHIYRWTQGVRDKSHLL